MSFRWNNVEVRKTVGAKVKYSFIWGQTIYVNDIEVGSRDTTMPPANEVYMFSRGWNNDVYQGRIYCLKIEQGGVLVRDFIPVRFTNENGQAEGAMFDRVSGELYRNQGTGAFIIGPDKR